MISCIKGTKLLLKVFTAIIIKGRLCDPHCLDLTEKCICKINLAYLSRSHGHARGHVNKNTSGLNLITFYLVPTVQKRARKQISKMQFVKARQAFQCD